MLADRRFVLGDLIALGEVRIEIVLAGKSVLRADGTAQRQPGPDRHLHGLPIDDGKYARHPEADGASLGVGR